MSLLRSVEKLTIKGYDVEAAGLRETLNKFNQLKIIENIDDSLNYNEKNF